MTKLNIHLYGNLFKETCEKKKNQTFASIK